MKLLIAGGRSFGYKWVKRGGRMVQVPNSAHLDLAYYHLGGLGPFVEQVVSGGARGADSVGEMWAHQHHLPVKRFLPDWEKNGKKAGIIRNIEMGDYADHLVAFWDGESKGTQHMIKYMQSLQKPTNVIYYQHDSID